MSLVAHGEDQLLEASVGGHDNGLMGESSLASDRWCRLGLVMDDCSGIN